MGESKCLCVCQQGRETVSGLELARVIATARVTMPRSVVRLSAGRLNFSFADQVCYCNHNDPVCRDCSMHCLGGAAVGNGHDSAR